MMLTPHALAGAALASLMPASTIGIVGAFSTGIASHYALDMVPHWERLIGPHYNDRLPKDHKHWPNHILIQGAADALIALVLLRYFSLGAPGSISLAVFLGGIGGILPDVLDNTPWWSRWTKKIPLWRSIEKLHRIVQMSYDQQRKLPHYTGIATQILTIALSLIILVKVIR